MKPTRNWRLRDRRPIAASTSRRKGRLPPASPSESRRRAGGGGSGRRGTAQAQRVRLLLSETGLVAFSFEEERAKTSRRMVPYAGDNEWESADLPLLFFYPFSCLILLLTPVTKSRPNGTVSTDAYDLRSTRLPLSLFVEVLLKILLIYPRALGLCLAGFGRAITALPAHQSSRDLCEMKANNQTRARGLREFKK